MKILVSKEVRDRRIEKEAQKIIIEAQIIAKLGEAKFYHTIFESHAGSRRIITDRVEALSDNTVIPMDKNMSGTSVGFYISIER